MRTWRMFDGTRELLERSIGRSSAEEAVTLPPQHTGVRNGSVSIPAGKSVVASEPKDDTISEEAIRDELSRILESSMFVQSDRLVRFLRFTVETTLACEAAIFTASPNSP